ncbi:MAG: type II CAAX endopeptidase family protein [Bacillota bacterium]|nr:type II CAAX endopeptidase family protein [Bacillota bacterium]
MKRNDDKISEIDKSAIKSQIINFMIICFGLTFILDFSSFVLLGPIYPNGSEKWGIITGIQMLIPAVTSIICMMISRDKSLRGANKLFLGVFILDSVISIGQLLPIGSSRLYQYILLAFYSGSLILLFIINSRKKSRAQLNQARLSFGSHKYMLLLMPLFYILIYIGNTMLNYVFNLADSSLKIDLGTFAITYMGFVGIDILFSWINYFGEEYGWRVYLQDRLTQIFGLRKGILLIGVIWGLWHAPIVAIGHGYPGHPVLGVIAMILSCITFGIILGYSIWKTGSVWISVILHLVNNCLVGPTVTYLCIYKSNIFSFGGGIYGIFVMGSISFVFLIFLKEKKLSFNKNTNKQSL